MTGPGEAPRHFAVGNDVLLEVVDAPGKKPIREHVLCPSRLADGGETKPRLGIWQNCRQDPACKIVSDADAGSPRVEVTCGKEDVVLEVKDGKTILRGSFGEREVSSSPMKIEAVKKETRNAAVDC